MVARGAVYWIDLDRRRPCVVVSAPDVLAADVWQTHVVPLTSNLDRAGLAGNVLLESAATGLPRDSVAVPLGFELVDRSWLTDYVGQGAQRPRRRHRRRPSSGAGAVGRVAVAG